MRSAVSPDRGMVRAPPRPPEGPELEAAMGSEVTVRATEGADAGSPCTAASSTLACCVELSALGPVSTSPVGLACPPAPTLSASLGFRTKPHRFRVLQRRSPFKELQTFDEH